MKDDLQSPSFITQPLPIVLSRSAMVIQFCLPQSGDMKNNNYVLYNFILFQVSFADLFSAPYNRFVPKDLNIMSRDYSISVASPRQGSS